MNSDLHEGFGRNYPNFSIISIGTKSLATLMLIYLTKKWTEQDFQKTITITLELKK